MKSCARGMLWPSHANEVEASGVEEREREAHEGVAGQIAARGEEREWIGGEWKKGKNADQREV